MNIHLNAGNKTLKRQTTLPAGTIVQIPDEYLKDLREGEDPQKALIRWLRQDVSLYQFTTSTGEQKQEYFTRVKIISVPSNLKKQFEGHEFHMALGYLAERENGLSFVTREDVDSYVYTNEEPIRQQASPTTEADCTGCQVQDPTPKIAPSIAQLYGLTKDYLQQVETLSNGYRSTKNTAQVIANFEATCKGVNFQDYKLFLKAEAEKSNVPLEVMLGIMTQESSGRCLAVDKGHANFGAFQINIGSKKASLELCTEAQRSRLAIATLDEMKSNSGLQCLENPVVNAREGIRIYLEKFKSSNKTQPPSLKQWSQYTAQERDDIRRAIAGYNGGQTHVNRAISDFQKFRDAHAPDLDVNSFELQRIFFFRELLKEHKYVASYENARTNLRSTENLAYTESITGRDNADSQGQSSFIASWEALLYRNPVPVAQKQ